MSQCSALDRRVMPHLPRPGPVQGGTRGLRHQRARVLCPRGKQVEGPGVQSRCIHGRADERRGHLHVDPQNMQLHLVYAVVGAHHVEVTTAFAGESQLACVHPLLQHHMMLRVVMHHRE